MKDLGELLKQASEMQAKAGELQERLARVEAQGSAGGGMVRTTLNGRFELKSVHIEAALLKPEERGVLADLLIAAHADARAKLETKLQEAMRDLAGGLGLPPGLLPRA